MSGHQLFAASRAQQGAGPVSKEYIDEDGRSQLGVAARIAPLGWTVIVEQPTREAYANATELQKQLVVAISIALLVMILVGLSLRPDAHQPDPHAASARRTRVAAGQLDARVDIRSRDEFGDLGDAFNTMADRLVQLQEDVKRQERQAMFGRVAAGLVHDLSHPIQNIGNSTRLLLRDDLDAESRGVFQQTIERELQTLKRFMDDLRHVVKPKPIERFPLDVNGSVAEIVESMRAEGERHGVTVDGQLRGPARWSSRATGSRSAASTATSSRMRFRRPSPAAASRSPRRRAGDLVEISVSDTGSGIPAERIAAIFDDFVTTKRRGLGLGLAISKRIVEQLNGTIVVESEVGRGTAFTLRFPGARRPLGRSGCKLKLERPVSVRLRPGWRMRCSAHS